MRAISDKTIHDVIASHDITHLIAKEGGTVSVFTDSDIGYAMCPGCRGNARVWHKWRHHRFSCMDCDLRGTVITWYMHRKGVSFKDATIALAAKAGVPVEWA